MGDITGIFSSVPIDWIILGSLALILTLDSLRSGIGRATAFAIALPLALLLYTVVSKAAFLGSLSVLSSSTYSEAGTFAIILILSYFLVRRMGVEYIDGGMGQPVQSIIAAVATVAVCVVIWLQIPVLDSLWHFSNPITLVFSESYRLFWLLGAYAALAFARG